MFDHVLSHFMNLIKMRMLPGRINATMRVSDRDTDYYDDVEILAKLVRICDLARSERVWPDLSEFGQDLATCDTQRDF